MLSVLLMLSDRKGARTGRMWPVIRVGQASRCSQASVAALDLLRVVAAAESGADGQTTEDDWWRRRVQMVHLVGALLDALAQVGDGPGRCSECLALWVL
jgi:hypothetical protein